MLFLSTFLYLLLFEGISKWLFSALYREALLINPHAHLPSVFEWIGHSLLWPRVWLRALLCALAFAWLASRWWQWISDQVLVVRGLLLLFLCMLPVMTYQFFLYRSFSLDNLSLYQPEHLCFVLTLVLYYTPIAFALSWFLKPTSEHPLHDD